LDSLLDGSTSEEEEVRIGHHLSDCATCRDRLNARTEPSDAMRAAWATDEVGDVPKDLLEAIRAAAVRRRADA
jgi:predicted anti-sigma-YlaC factor YlaD